MVPTALKQVGKGMNDRMKFTKMHGCGNDYVYVNCLEETVKHPDKVAQFVSDRHFGIGSDGLILMSRLRMQTFAWRCTTLMVPVEKCAATEYAVLQNMSMITG